MHHPPTVFIKPAKEFDILQTAGVNIGPQHADGDVEGVADDRHHHKQQHAYKATAAHGAHFVDHRAYHSTGKPQSHDTGITEQIRHKARDAIQFSQTAGDAAKALFVPAAQQEHQHHAGNDQPLSHTDAQHRKANAGKDHIPGAGVTQRTQIILLPDLPPCRSRHTGEDLNSAQGQGENQHFHRLFHGIKPQRRQFHPLAQHAFGEGGHCVAQPAAHQHTGHNGAQSAIEEQSEHLTHGSFGLEQLESQETSQGNEDTVHSVPHDEGKECDIKGHHQGVGIDQAAVTRHAIHLGDGVKRLGQGSILHGRGGSFPFLGILHAIGAAFPFQHLFHPLLGLFRQPAGDDHGVFRAHQARKKLIFLRFHGIGVQSLLHGPVGIAAFLDLADQVLPLLFHLGHLLFQRTNILGRSPFPFLRSLGKAPLLDDGHDLFLAALMNEEGNITLFIVGGNLLHLAGRRFLRQFLFQLFQIGRSGQNAPEIFHRPVHMVLQGHIQVFPWFELGHCDFQPPDLPQQAVHFLGRLVDLPGSGQGLIQHLFIIKLTFGQLGLSRQQRPAGWRHILGQDFHSLSDDRQIFPGPCVFFRRALQGIFLPEIGGFLGGLHLYATRRSWRKRLRRLLCSATARRRFISTSAISQRPFP